MSRRSTPSSQDFTKAVGRGATTEEVAEKLRISVDAARDGLSKLRGLKIVIEDERDHWRQA